MYTASILKVMEPERGNSACSTEYCKEVLSKYDFHVLHKSDVKPVMSVLKEEIFATSRNSELVIIMGGTGLLWEDIATEAVLSLIDKRAQGLEISMVHNALKKDREFSRYRCAAGTILNSVVLSIPGKKESVEWYLEPVLNTIKTLLNEWRKKRL
ncbi:MAG: molybdopterin-binding protein [Thermotogae bacterium]|uniref:Molybdopterin-binding protein n=1 Tax=Kosmotoga arenicorallina TaxID=688066 RepID=A0A7C5HXZ7_9BACT|nr:molybdopterin-binding protein [Kosmotoga sp.]MBO8165625.1 molybdopterin-binding protein [Kosmotoga sp.]MCD6159883.1 molybdopterin-binding protein [Kosmotoga sp.]RKX49698.1 MAG: molybdopterin-binding protein [Thermotogota bacterium]HHF08393.1 molybdopterin-binding protein [Kosmotoga arenicorallina]